MRRTGLVLILLGLFSGRTSGQSYEIVHSFSVPGLGTNGLVAAANGVFYGTTDSGGRYARGSIFRLEPSGGGQFSVYELHTFFDLDGISPRGLARGPEGDFWGVTLVGGGAGVGCVFRIDESGHFTRVHRFNLDDGANPTGPPQAAVDQAVYGTTAGGGVNGKGTAYRVDLFGAFTKIHDFNGADGADPEGRLLFATDGFLYGTTAGGGANDLGTIFRMDLAGNVETLYSFSGADGKNPKTGLVEADGSFYGTTFFGGASNWGTLFRRDPNGTVTVLHSFDSTDGAEPIAELVQALDGSLTFFGTTSYGGPGGWGTAFRMDAAGVVTTLHDFDLATGSTPGSPLILQLDGSLFGTTYYGGPYGRGTVFHLDASDQWSLVAGFRADEGYDPIAAVVEGFDGALYGATRLGGAGDMGTLFRVEPGTGAFTIIHGFSGADGAYPGAGAALLPASDGSYYGTTRSGGASDMGTLFRLDDTLKLTTLYEFSGTDGASPQGRLVEWNGNLYGETGGGGTGDFGTTYRISLLGDFLSLHSFAGSDGLGPSGGLLHNADGSFYGTTAGGGASNWGTVFAMDEASGVVTTIHDAAPGGGINPVSSLTLMPGGELVAASSGNVAVSDYGSVFRLDTSGQNFEVVHAFSGTDGAFPQAGVLLAADGNLYGTAGPGAGNSGSIYRIDSSDAFSVLHLFTGSDGGSPAADLIQGADGALYGTAETGGVSGEGVVFRMLLAPASPTISAITPGSGSAAGGTTFVVTGTHFQRFPLVTLGGVALDTFGPDATGLLGLSPELAPGTISDLVLVNPDSTSATLEKAWFADFLDVAHLNLFHDSVEAIFRAGITAGCGGGNYCVYADVTRAQMAVFLLKAEHGSSYVPPSCTGVFGDVTCPGGFAADWIERLAAEGITSGCGGGNYCPGAPVTRAQMAVFLLKTSLGSGYAPPVVAQIFDDVAPGSFAADWINDLFTRGITGGCSASPLLYCPGNSNTRGQMAVFLTRTFLAP